MALGSQCTQPGCTRPRARLSIFCDEHHDDRLKRVGLWRERRPHDPAAELVRRCERIVRAWRAGAYDEGECVVQLCDVFGNAAVRDSPDCWPPALGSLPRDVLGGMRAYVRGPDARVPGWSFPTTMADAEREASSRVILGQLAAALEQRLADAP